MLDDLWSAATKHAFLVAIRDQTLSAGAFERWLGQDAFYVADLLRFQARLLARAPRPAQRVLAEGCVGLVAELDWYSDKAVQLGMSLEQERLPATAGYAELLARLDDESYEAAVTALWVIEQVYLDAWTTALSASSPWLEFIEHWTTTDFRTYVAALRLLAHPDRYPELVADVLQHEIEFWDMALS